MNKLSQLLENFEKSSQEQAMNIETQLKQDFQRHESVIKDALTESENSILNGIEYQKQHQLRLLYMQSQKMKEITENFQLNAHAESVERALKTNEEILLKAVKEQNKRLNVLVLKNWIIVPFVALLITLILAVMSANYTNQIMDRRADLANLGVVTTIENGQTYLVLSENSLLVRKGVTKNNQEVWILHQRN